MNQTTLVIVAALAASALIIGTAGILQPAAAIQIQSNQEIKQGLAQCNFKGSSSHRQLPTSSKHDHLQSHKLRYNR